MAAAPPQQQYQQAPQQYQQPPQQYQQPQYPQPSVDAQNEKVLAIVGYFLFFVPLLAAPNSKLSRYHANQGLILLLSYAALGIADAIFGSFVWRISWGLWSVLSVIFTLVYLGLAVLGIIGIVNAAQSQTKPMPIIGGLLTIIK